MKILKILLISLIKLYKIIDAPSAIKIIATVLIKYFGSFMFVQAYRVCLKVEGSSIYQTNHLMSRGIQYKFFY